MPERRRRAALAASLVVFGWPAVAHAAGGLTQRTFFEIALVFGVVGIGYVITHYAVERISARFTLAGGVEYVLLGVVLGPVLRVIDPDVAIDIRPLLLLGVGSLAMLAGLELGEEARSRERSRGAWTAATAIALSTALAVLGVPLLVAWAVGYPLAGPNAWTAVLVAAGVLAIGSDSAPLRIMAERLRANSPLSELGVFVAHRAHAFATIACGVLFALLEPGETLALRDPAEFARAFGIELGSGIALGLLFGVVMHRKLDDRTRLTLVLGMVFLAGGFAFAMGVSEIFVASVAGWTFARTSRFSRDALQTMRSIGQPFVIALYFFAGLEWVTGSPWAWALVVPFVLLRQAGRRFGGFFGARMVGSGANLAASTFSPGGLSIAILLSFTLVFQDLPGVRDAYGPFLAALVLLETGSLRAARRWLLDVADVSFRRAKRGT